MNFSRFFFSIMCGKITRQLGVVVTRIGKGIVFTSSFVLAQGALLSVSSHPKSSLVTSYEHMLVTGTLESGSHIAVEVNGNSISPRLGSTNQFSAVIGLQVGTNTVRLTALLGTNVESQTLVFTRSSDPLDLRNRSGLALAMLQDGLVLIAADAQEVLGFIPKRFGYKTSPELDGSHDLGRILPFESGLVAAIQSLRSDRQFYTGSVPTWDEFELHLLDIPTGRMSLDTLPGSGQKLETSLTPHYGYIYANGTALYGYEIKTGQGVLIATNCVGDAANRWRWPFIYQQSGAVWTSRFAVNPVSRLWGATIQKTKTGETETSLCGPYFYGAADFGSFSLSPDRKWLLANGFGYGTGFLLAVPNDVRECAEPTIVGNTADGCFDTAVLPTANGGFKVFVCSQTINAFEYSGLGKTWKALPRISLPTDGNKCIAALSDMETLAIGRLNGIEFHRPNQGNEKNWTLVTAQGVADISKIAPIKGPMMTIVHAEETLNISWTPLGGVLQRAPTPTGPWEDFGTVSPTLVSTEAGTTFFRVANH